MVSDWWKYNWFWHGIKSGYKECCIFFFMNVWSGFDKEIKQNWTSTGEGYIPCPDCLARLLSEQVKKDLIIQRSRS